MDGDSSLRAESVEGLTVYDEVQMMRRQIAKLNHRLMAVELENQQQQQREMVRLEQLKLDHGSVFCTISRGLRLF